jgi:hypothetical protein
LIELHSISASEDASGNLVSIAVIWKSKKNLARPLVLRLKALNVRTAGEHIPVPPLKNQKQLSYLGGQQ